MPTFLTLGWSSSGAFLDSKEMYNRLSNPKTACNRTNISSVKIFSNILFSFCFQKYFDSIEKSIQIKKK
jgi:hypothetical protein